MTDLGKWLIRADRAAKSHFTGLLPLHMYVQRAINSIARTESLHHSLQLAKLTSRIELGYDFTAEQLSNF